MPAYNASHYIAEAIDSLLNQTFRDFELWIVDDGSSDRTAILAQKYAKQDPRVKVFKNPANQGRVLTVNATVHKVSTPYFTITDADDVSHPQRLEKQMQLLMENRNLMMCGSSYWAMDAQGYLVRKMRLLRGLHEIREQALYQSPFMGPTTVMRKEVLFDFPEFYRIYFKDNQADADLSTRLLDKYETTNLEESLYYYRILDTSLTRREITIRNLTLSKLIAHLSWQRRNTGSDCLEKGNPQEANEFMKTLEEAYRNASSLFFRHQAFFHLYWGLNRKAFQTIWKAFLNQPFAIKNILGVPLVLSRIIFFVLYRRVFRRHYSRQIR